MSTVNFVLGAFESTATLQTEAVLPDFDPAAISSDADITLTTQVALSALKNVFYYRTDDSIQDPNAFVYHFVDMSAWTNFSTDMNPKNGVVTSGYYGSNSADDIGKDFLRDLANQLFGTYIGADLFTNEDAVVSDIHARCDEIASAITATLTAVDQTNGTHSGIANDSTAGRTAVKYMPDTDQSTNICRVILNTLLDQSSGQPSRFADIANNSAVVGLPAGYFHVPFVAGDELHFKVTVNSHANQETTVGTTTNSLSPRTYKVRMVVGD